MNEYGIEQTMDVIAYIQGLADEMMEAKKEDGKISVGEIVSTLMTTSPSALSAFIGSSDIDKEIADFSEEERKQVLTAAVKVIQTFGKLFSKVSK